jgi:hypothetical protein
MHLTLLVSLSLDLPVHVVLWLQKTIMGAWRGPAFIAITLGALLEPSPSWGTAVITTSADPADGWRAIAPVGNLAGQPLSAVGLGWEAAHVGWNTSLAFDDSDAAGWHPPVVRDVIQYGATTTNSIWAGDPQGAGDTPGYFRKTFTLDSDPVVAQLGGTFFPTDASSVIDDDAQVYVNGALIYDDQDFFPTHFPLTDVTAYLHAGQNLIAVKAQDSVGGDEHFSLTLRINPIPEPTTLLLLSVGVAGLAFEGRGSRRRESRGLGLRPPVRKPRKACET